MAAMTTTERRSELATIRLLGGTAGGAAIVVIAVAACPTASRASRSTCRCHSSAH
jgi:hypothetical protein